MCSYCRKPNRWSWTVAAAPSDDPYSLLNVSRGASREEVGCASGQETYRLHEHCVSLSCKRIKLCA